VHTTCNKVRLAKAVQKTDCHVTVTNFRKKSASWELIIIWGG
jgi:hypothetical protein